MYYAYIAWDGAGDAGIMGIVDRDSASESGIGPGFGSGLGACETVVTSGGMEGEWDSGISAGVDSEGGELVGAMVEPAAVCAVCLA